MTDSKLGLRGLNLRTVLGLESLTTKTIAEKNFIKSSSVHEHSERNF